LCLERPANPIVHAPGEGPVANGEADAKCCYSQDDEAGGASIHFIDFGIRKRANTDALIVVVSAHARTPVLHCPISATLYWLAHVQSGSVPSGTAQNVRRGYHPRRISCGICIDRKS